MQDSRGKFDAITPNLSIYFVGFCIFYGNMVLKKLCNTFSWYIMELGISVLFLVSSEKVVLGIFHGVPPENIV